MSAEKGTFALKASLSRPLGDARDWEEAPRAPNGARAYFFVVKKRGGGGSRASSPRRLASAPFPPARRASGLPRASRAGAPDQRTSARGATRVAPPFPAAPRRAAVPPPQDLAQRARPEAANTPLTQNNPPPPNKHPN